MGSKDIIKELFAVAKASKQFVGMDEKEIWEACLAYQDRSDKDIRRAMNNIKKKDLYNEKKAEKQQEKLQSNKEKMIEIREQEQLDHKQDEENAEKILEEHFNM